MRIEASLGDRQWDCRWIDACEHAVVHDLHYHDLRHTALSWLVEAGVDNAVVQRLAGHRIQGMTESCLHLWETRLREAVIVLERVQLKSFRLRCMTNGESFNRRTMGGKTVDGQLWAVRKMVAACNSTEEWCRGTELNCRHQPFQGINKMSRNSNLHQKDGAKSNISYHGISMSYRSRCH